MHKRMGNSSFATLVSRGFINYLQSNIEKASLI